MNSKFSKFKSGFSLIELMVVIVLMLIMTAVLFLNQSKNKAQQDVESSARQFVAELRSLQNDALNGKLIDTNKDSIPDTSSCRFYFRTMGGYSIYGFYYWNCATETMMRFADGAGYIAPIVDISKKRVIFTGASTAFYFSVPLGMVYSEAKVHSAQSFTITSTIDSAIAMCVKVSIDGSITAEKNACP